MPDDPPALGLVAVKFAAAPPIPSVCAVMALDVPVVVVLWAKMAVDVVLAVTTLNPAPVPSWVTPRITLELVPAKFWGRAVLLQAAPHRQNAWFAQKQDWLQRPR
jgi:hypothetical protein